MGASTGGSLLGGLEGLDVSGCALRVLKDAVFSRGTTRDGEDVGFAAERMLAFFFLIVPLGGILTFGSLGGMGSGEDVVICIGAETIVSVDFL